MTIVLHRHLRELGYCNRGARTWFARHGLDWRAFLDRGLPSDAFAQTGDAMALRLVEHAKGATDGR